jgi:hypothetical protein
MNYLYLLIDSAINYVIYREGFIASGVYYDKFNRQLAKLVEYKKELKLYPNDLKQRNRIEKNFKRFCKRNDIEFLQTYKYNTK